VLLSRRFEFGLVRFLAPRLFAAAAAAAAPTDVGASCCIRAAIAEVFDEEDGRVLVEMTREALYEADVVVVDKLFDAVAAAEIP
jgi:hypothetical protein